MCWGVCFRLSRMRRGRAAENPVSERLPAAGQIPARSELRRNSRRFKEDTTRRPFSVGQWLWLLTKHLTSDEDYIGGALG